MPQGPGVYRCDVVRAGRYVSWCWRADFGFIRVLCRKTGGVALRAQGASSAGNATDTSDGAWPVIAVIGVTSTCVWAVSVVFGMSWFGTTCALHC